MRLQIELVTRWLRESPETRDDDGLLCATIWYYEAKSQGLLNDTMAFLFAYSKGKFTSAETITRSRRKVQEMNPELRGRNYQIRKQAGKQFKP